METNCPPKQYNDNSTCFTPKGDLIVSYNNKIQIGSGHTGQKVYPQEMLFPSRSISQRSGTNIIDLDFEIVDPDDANAGRNWPPKRSVHSRIMDYTSMGGWHRIKIGTPVTTNQVHQVSWNVKGVGQIKLAP